jgi:hypothetical protein
MMVEAFEDRTVLDEAQLAAAAYPARYATTPRWPCC